MKLNPLQWLWFAAAAACLAVVLLDVTDVIDVPTVVLLVAPAVLVLVGRKIGPSMAEITRANRRG